MVVSTCCGCISLEDGSMFLAILKSFGWLITLIASIKLTFSLNLTSYKSRRFWVEAGSVGLIALSIIMITISISFVIGINKKNKNYLSPYVAVTFTQLILNIPISICFITDIWINHFMFDGIFIFFLIYIPFAALEAYFWLVAYSYYKTLDKKGYGPNSPHDLI